jgi:GAF domain-containing protein
MIPAQLPVNEDARLKSLQEHELLDTLPEDEYDEITKMASQICGTPIALLTLVDEKRQWFKSKQGLNVNETSREYSFCAHAILDSQGIFIVPDARYDERFHDNPLTKGEPEIIFYVGVVVKDIIGNALGTLSVVDNRPRELSDSKLEALKALAKLVETHFRLRKTKMEMELTRNNIKQLNNHLTTLRLSLEALNKNKDDLNMASVKSTLESMNEITNKFI